jgi:alkylation response protein AidB-like acyl-CoA dehydrogenase
MRLALSEDQRILAKTAAAFVANRSPLSRAHKLRHDSSSSLGYSPVVWKEMAALGWTGIPFGEKEGGAGLGIAEVVIVTEALGRCLAPEPFLPSVMMAGQALALAGTESQRSRWLARIISADGVLALAHQEAGARYDVSSVATAACKTQDGYRLSGAKIHVAGGYGAEAFVVTARTSGSQSHGHGITMFLVPADTPGIHVVSQHRVDSRNAAMLKLTDAQVPETAVIGQPDRGREVLEDVIDRATVALCGEMLGAMAEALDRTLAYLKERVQFGVVIGTFQALKHRVARLFIEVELARSAVLAAARAIDEGAEHRATLASNAKARCSEAYRLIANEAIQLHGGIGMTDEHEIGMFIKHAAVATVTFGDARHHRERFANLCGY